MNVFNSVLFSLVLLLGIQQTLQQVVFKMTLTNKLDHIMEDEVQYTIVAKAQCNKECLCNLQSANIFQIDYTGISKDTFDVRYSGGSITDQYYDLNVTCVDTDSSDDQWKAFRIFVLKFFPPIVTSGSHGYDQIHLDSKTPYLAGSVVYIVTAQDINQSKPLTYKLSQNSPLFKIDQYSGNITTTSDLRLVKVDDFQLNITVSNSKGKKTLFILHITIGVNKPPDIFNLPRTITLEENKFNPLSAVFFTPSCIDPDSTVLASMLELTCAITPTEEAKRFNIQSTSSWTLLQALDYEKSKQINISCILSDTFLQSDQKILIINVLDVNEPPYFVNTVFYCTLNEGAVGVSFCTLDIKVEDPDKDSIKSVEINSFSSTTCRKLIFDMATKRITFSEPYDLENNDDSICTLQLEAKDDHNLTSSNKATVHVTINDVNDRTCAMPPLPLQPNFNFLSLLDVVGRVNAVDNDVTSPNNLVTYELLRGQPSEAMNYFSVANNGLIYYISTIPESHGPRVFTLYVKCHDGGTPQRSAEITVLIRYEWTTTTSTTTTTTTTTIMPPTTETTTTQQPDSDDVFENSAFLALFVVLMTLLAVGLVALTYYCLKQRGLCRVAQKPVEPTVRTVEPVQKPSQDSFYSDLRGNNAPKKNTQYQDLYWKNDDNYEIGARNGAIPEAFT